ncbi:hypothetical protein RB596_006787 [Gaeumannomyces avenae]
MDASGEPSAAKDNLFKVFLRLRPPYAASGAGERFLAVEEPESEYEAATPTHVTLTPPSNGRKHATEKYCFTRVLEEDASQLDVFQCTGVLPLVEGVLGPQGGEGTDALLATLGVTGSGKTHTLLGSRTQRGMTQLSLDVLFRSIGQNIATPNAYASLEASVAASDVSEATILAAPAFIDTVFADPHGASRPNSRAPTPMNVGDSDISIMYLQDDTQKSEGSAATGPRISVLWCPPGGLDIPGAFPDSPKSARVAPQDDCIAMSSPVPLKPKKKITGLAAGLAVQSRPRTPARHFMAATASTLTRKNERAKPDLVIKGESSAPPPTSNRRLLPRPTAFATSPDVSSISVASDPAAEYVVLVSMYEVYNNAIHDLLTPPIKSVATKEYRRRALLFKATEQSQDRKVVAGLKKVLCTSLSQALMVLEAGIHERSVAGTSSNRASSRSHGFFCVEVKKRRKSRRNGPGGEPTWGGSTLTIVDLAGSERARDAKTTGVTLAEAGKINESLMYFGQCLQLQAAAGQSAKPSGLSFRHCKLTEILFSNTFASPSGFSRSHASRRAPQKGVLIVNADPHGDFSATSQILRYSALACEVTAPRIPSITQAILAATATKGAAHQQHQGNQSMANSSMLSSSPVLSPTSHHRPFFAPSGSSGSVPQYYHSGGSPNIQRTLSPSINTASSDERATMEAAALEIARLSEELDYMRSTVETERSRRVEAESQLLSLEDRLLELEQEIREDCMVEFEQRLVVEMARWKASLELEKERGEEHWDRKVEVLERLQVASPGGDSHDEHDDKENVLVENLEEENERLRREVMVLKRELAGRSPTKRKPLMEREDLATEDVGPGSASNSPRGGSAADSLQRKMERLRVSDNAGRGSSASSSSRNASGNVGHGGGSAGSSPRKVRKLAAAKRWEAAGQDDEMF